MHLQGIFVWRRCMNVQNWRLTGDDTAGTIVGDHEEYAFTVEDGEVRIRLPFIIDEERLTAQLTEDGWAVANSAEDAPGSHGWGDNEDIDGYYPCWVFPDEEKGETHFVFPPKDYRARSDARISAALGEVAVEHHPYLGQQSLEEFSRWLPYLKAAAR